MINDNSVLFTIEKHIATLTINKPQIRNAFDDKIIAKMSTSLDNINTNQNIRALVLTGSGDHFSAGADLNWMKSMINYTFDENQKDALNLAAFLKKLNNLNIPTIALVKGSVFGGALGLVACCDIAICEENSKFCLSEVKLGLSPAVISPYVINAIGQRHARRFMLTAEPFDAKTAYEIHLVHIVKPKDELENTLDELTQQITNNGPIATKTTKKLILDIVNNNYNGNLKVHTSKIISQLRVSPEGQEGLNSFFDKRKPNWVVEE